MKTQILYLFVSLMALVSAQAAPIRVTSDTVAVYTLIGEAVNQGEKGMVAVAEVIRNRAKKYHQSCAQVCLEKAQFSFWNDSRRAKRFLAEHQAYIPAARRAWEKSAGTRLTKGATHYDSKDFKQPDWALFARLTAEIGKHRFYCLN